MLVSLMQSLIRSTIKESKRENQSHKCSGYLENSGRDREYRSRYRASALGSQIEVSQAAPLMREYMKCE